MTLRADIHDAFDELGPSTPGLTERVIQSGVAGPVRHSGTAWVRRFRAPLSLVAVLVLIALVVGAFVGGRLIHDWNSYLNRSIPGGQIDPQVLRTLESRPLVQPLIHANDPCPGGPWNPSTGWWGAGPVFVSSPIASGYGPVANSAWGIYAVFHAQTPTGMTGPVLIRARDLVSGAPLVFVGRYASGAVIAIDRLHGQDIRQQPEVAIDTTHPATAPSAGFVDWAFTIGVHEDFPTPRPGTLTTLPLIRCTGWQIDAPNFTAEVFEVPI